jgi:hypothetical protein
MGTPNQSNLSNLTASRTKKRGTSRVVLSFKAGPETVQDMELLKAAAAGFTRQSVSYGILIRRALAVYADFLQAALMQALEGNPVGSAEATLDRYAAFMAFERAALLAAAGEKRGPTVGSKNKSKEKKTPAAEEVTP